MLEYEITPPKDRTMDQHSQALLDLYRSAIDMADKLPPLNKKNSYRKKHNKKSLYAIGKIFVYIHKHFPIVETEDYKNHLEICRMHVFNINKNGSIFDTFSRKPKPTIQPAIRTEIAGTDKIWTIPPMTSYYILPIVIVRDGFCYAKLPMATALATKRGKEFGPYREYFCDTYARIIMES